MLRLSLGFRWKMEVLSGFGGFLLGTSRTVPARPTSRILGLGGWAFGKPTCSAFGAVGVGLEGYKHEMCFFLGVFTYICLLNV